MCSIAGPSAVAPDAKLNLDDNLSLRSERSSKPALGKLFRVVT